eukprot:SM000038S14283  [mRNA]  locus=s38:28726:32526:+ [translate_table: standard]
MEKPRPAHVGILAMEVYFPPTYVEQAELETHDGVSAGKYTIGLGQTALAFCSDQEDVISMSLTVVKRLLEKTGVDPKSIGRIDVGSETVIDKSKSIKSTLMMLFQDSGNSDIEGVDSTNACYGGTAALFNCLNWVEGSSWDGRYALAVAADSAVYAEGPARPTGGAGAVAMLIGPDAPLAAERQLTASHMAHVYDFYKPRLASEYPVVDGRLSQVCYLQAAEKCYDTFCTKFAKKEGSQFSLAAADYIVFHAPYNKLVQKGLARLAYHDFLAGRVEDPGFLAALEPFAGISQDESYTNKDLEKALMRVTKDMYLRKVGPSEILPKQVGNMYCASLYASLASLVSEQSNQLEGKRIVMFSYGSGLASSLFSFTVRAVSSTSSKFSISSIASQLDLPHLLKLRRKVSPGEFVKTMELMETRYGAHDFIPVTPNDNLRPGTYYLMQVDALYRRFYSRTSNEMLLTDSKRAVANGSM